MVKSRTRCGWYMRAQQFTVGQRWPMVGNCASGRVAVRALVSTWPETSRPFERLDIRPGKKLLAVWWPRISPPSARASPCL